MCRLSGWRAYSGLKIKGFAVRFSGLRASRASGVPDNNESRCSKSKGLGLRGPGAESRCGERPF